MTGGADVPSGAVTTAAAVWLAVTTLRVAFGGLTATRVRA
jgi:hypothetical protein